eukprot:1403861-Amphidinium_carterae.1
MNTINQGAAHATRLDRLELQMNEGLVPKLVHHLQNFMNATSQDNLISRERMQAQQARIRSMEDTIVAHNQEA